MNQDIDLSIDISEYEFSKKSLANISENRWVKNLWPLVYFIKNDNKKIAYVGESTKALSRINDHLGNEKRSALDRLSIIGCDKFNKSATLDIESKLIQYISSEGSYELQNGNNGLLSHNYYQSSLYDELFKEIWKKLIENKVVSKTLEQIQNSNFFKYSPYKSLSQDQLNSVLEIIESLNKKDSVHIFIKGSAGTGKTILATYLIKLLKSKDEGWDAEDVNDENYREVKLLADYRKKHVNPTIGLVIAMTSLRTTLQKVFEKIPDLDSSMVISPSDTFKKKYDILIVDEAHRLRQRKNISWMGVFTKNNNKLGLGNDGTELDWILANSTHQIFFYDSAQSVKPSDVPQEKFNDLLAKYSTIQLELKSQMRVDAGSDYITFVDNLLNCRLGKEKIKYEPLNYELLAFDSFIDLYAQLDQKEKEYRLCRLVAGYAWPWETAKKNPSRDYDIEIEGLKFCWNKTDKDWIGTKTSFKEIGCIHTIQGYDLNYVGVIFGKEIIYNPEEKNIEIISENYYDRNGKAGISHIDDLKEFIINIYKTMMYRGIRGAYIYACDAHLREYLAKHIQKFENKSLIRMLSVDKVIPYVNAVPIYDFKIAAGSFSAYQMAGDFSWVELPEHMPIGEGYFVAQVLGESMNKKIPSGSWCLFKSNPAGSRNGKIVLVQHRDIQDTEMGGHYTVKEYSSEKSDTDDGSWEHAQIILRPKTTAIGYKDIVLKPEQMEDLKVIGEFVDIIGSS